jgi:hypothetical protein
VTTYPLSALRALLAADQPTQGVVVRIVGTDAEIATASGMRHAKTVGTLAVGDPVTLTQGIASRRAKASADYPL